MSDWTLYLALLAALAIGFYAGVRQARKGLQDSSQTQIDDHYFQGLNFLLNEQPDAAIDTFIRALEVNSDTLETHLALGKLLRKRGEVDRAIRIHQNLLARPGLTLQHVQQAQYELAMDFAKAGLFDRAEGLLVELVSREGLYRVAGLQCLLEVYRDEKEWLKGLEVLQKLSGSRLSRTYEKWAPIRAHFCCELAEIDFEAKRYENARHWLKQALSYERQSIRAALLLGKLEIAVGDNAKGIIQLERLLASHTDYAAEIIPLLTTAYQVIGNTQKYKAFLLNLHQREHDVVVLLALADLIAQQESDLVAAEYVANEIIKHPSGVGLHKLLDYYLAFAEGKTFQYLSSLKVVMERVIAKSAYYQCQQCGFKGQSLHWLCPSCKSWGGLKSKRTVADEV